MKVNCRGFALAFVTALFACLAPALAQHSAESVSPGNRTPGKLADAFRHPLLPGDDSKAGSDAEQWYVSEDFGDPFGNACLTLKSKVCYNLGENWKHEKEALGRPVYAIANGEILDFGYAPTPEGRLPDSLGNYILIKHTLPAPGRRIPGVGSVTTIVSLYAYLKDLKRVCGDDSRSCRVGQRVRIGAVIGHVGNTGAAKGASLHFEIRLTEEKCVNGSQQTNVNASCLGYSNDRYPAHYAKGGGWLDPTCFIENRRVPRNDSVADAISIKVGETLKGRNLCATKEAGEPNHAGKKISRYGLNADGKSVWWKFTAPQNMQYTISTVGSKFDTLLGVYADPGQSSSNLIVVAQNDNEKRSLCAATSYCTSTVSFTATAGTTYYIAVDGASSDGIAAVSGDIRLTAEEADTQLFVSPNTTSFEPGYEGGPFAQAPVTYQVSASKEQVAFWISSVPAWLTPSRTAGRTDSSTKAVAFTLNDEANSLKAGTYTATIVFGSSSQAPQVRKITLTIKTRPELKVTPAGGVEISGDQSGPFDPSSFSYTISTTSGRISYRVSGVPSWLTVSSRSGRLTTTPQAVTFLVNSNANALAPGTYNATVTFTNTTNGKGTVAIPIVLTVNELPSLNVAPATPMAASGLQGGPFSPASASYQISATTGTLTYALSGMPSWLTVSSPSGTATTTPKAVTFSVNANANELPAGTHNATVTFTNTTNGKGTIAIPIVLTVTALPLPSLQVTPGTPMAASGPQGGPFNPVSFAYQITATSGTLTYAISGVPSWLTVSSPSGSATTTSQTITFTVNPNANALATGTHHATIAFTNVTNGSGTTSTSIVLTVSAPPALSFLIDGAGGYLLDSSGGRLVEM